MNNINELTVGELIRLCKEYNLDPDKTPVMYCDVDNNESVTVLTCADVNKDIIEVYWYENRV